MRLSDEYKLTNNRGNDRVYFIRSIFITFCNSFYYYYLETVSVILGLSGNTFGRETQTSSLIKNLESFSKKTWYI